MTLVTGDCLQIETGIDSRRTVYIMRVAGYYCNNDRLQSIKYTQSKQQRQDIKSIFLLVLLKF